MNKEAKGVPIALAQVVPTQRGIVDIDRVFGASASNLLAHLNTEGQHRGNSSFCSCKEKESNVVD